MAEATPFLPGLSPVEGKPLTATLDAGSLSSDGGLVVLRESAARLGLAAMIADRSARRARSAARHRTAIADDGDGADDGDRRRLRGCDDVDALRPDPALMIACERAPESGAIC